MAAAMENTGSIIACDSMSQRLDRLRDNVARLRISNIDLRQLTWGQESEGADLPPIDAILLDVPCSNSGVMQRRVDVRWRLQPEEFKQMPITQLEIVEAVLPFLKSGGRLVYSTCSIDRAENEAVVEQVLEQHSDLTLIKEVTSLPWVTGHDGAYAALLRKA